MVRNAIVPFAGGRRRKRTIRSRRSNRRMSGGKKRSKRSRKRSKQVLVYKDSKGRKYRIKRSENGRYYYKKRSRKSNKVTTRYVSRGNCESVCLYTDEDLKWDKILR